MTNWEEFFTLIVTLIVGAIIGYEYCRSKKDKVIAGLLFERIRGEKFTPGSVWPIQGAGGSGGNGGGIAPVKSMPMPMPIKAQKDYDDLLNMSYNEFKQWQSRKK